MAKKGGVQQLQADITNDEEFEKFLDRPGLLVLDVYSEWCGPCLGMVGSLKKIKLELGGDNLHLAICKSDTITQLKRFNKKSEPTWLFVVNGKAVNLLFGTNVPKLMKVIAHELTLLSKTSRDKTYNINEYQPEEVERRRVKEDAFAEAERIELADKEKKRKNYLNSVTDTIMENLPDIGVTVFGPQVNRDMFKKIMEPADVLKIQCKDRKVIPVTKADFEIVNFACKNPLEPDVLEQLYGKELLLCFWKVPEDQNVPDVLTHYALELTKKRVEPPDDYNEEEREIPPILAPMDVKVEYELEDDEQCITEEPPPEDRRKSRRTIITELPTGELIEEVIEEDEDEEEGEEEEEGGEMPEMPMMDMDLNLDLGFEDEEASKEDESQPEPVVEEIQKRTCTKTVKIPPIWVPTTKRAHASLIYVFFRLATGPFLPPDPVPEPPHIVMAFDAYKKKDLISLAERLGEDVPLYGFFSSDDPEEAKFLANSAEKYAQQTYSSTDKIVFKVNKKTSHTMLSLATYGPSYVSPNTVLGRDDALKFFPENYKTAAQELEEELAAEAAEPKKKRRTKKSVVTPVVEAPVVVEESVRSKEGEGEGTTSGEETGDSLPPVSDEAAPPPTEEQAAAAAAAAAEAAEAPAPPPPAEENVPAPAPEAAPETPAAEAPPPEPTAE